LQQDEGNIGWLNDLLRGVYLNNSTAAHASAKVGGGGKCRPFTDMMRRKET